MTVKIQGNIINLNNVTYITQAYINTFYNRIEFNIYFTGGGAVTIQYLPSKYNDNAENLLLKIKLIVNNIAELMSKNNNVLELDKTINLKK